MNTNNNNPKQGDFEPIYRRSGQRLWLFGIALLLIGCGKIEPAPQEPLSPYEITFHTDGVATRAQDTLAEGATFGVLAYTCPTGIFDPIISLPNLLYNARVDKYISDGYSGYRYMPTTHWPSGANTKVMFAAYYPHNTDVATGSITLSPFTSTGLPKITVVMGLEKGSIDFATDTVGPIARTFSGITAQDKYPRATNYVNFSFKRRMSYITFRAKGINMAANTRLFINGVTIRNIYRRGVFNLSNSTWEDRGIDATSGATLRITSVGSPVSNTDFKDISNPNNPEGTSISVIPQEYDNVELSVTYTIEYLKPEGGCEHQITGTKIVPLTVKWEMGKLYVYDIEFAFNEIYGDNVLFYFNVKDWDGKTINTIM